MCVWCTWSLTHLKYYKVKNDNLTQILSIDMLSYEAAVCILKKKISYKIFEIDYSNLNYL